MGIGKRGQVYSQMFSWDLCLLLTAMLNVFLTHLIHRFSIKKWGRGGIFLLRLLKGPRIKYMKFLAHGKYQINVSQ